MPNTNFQTIHQMGGAINSFVKQATGRDAVQNIDMEHITVAQNHYYEDVDISGRVVSFNACAAGIPLEKCLVQIEPVQEGTGDPSPDNVRPISGWAGAKVTRTGKNLLPMPIESGSYANDVSVTVNADKSFYVTKPSSSGWTNFPLVSGMMLKAGTYTIIESDDSSQNSTLNIYYAGTNTTWLNTRYNKRKVFTINEDMIFDIVYSRAGSADNVLTKIMLFMGDTATADDYVPYQGETYPITFPSEAGTVYGGTLDVTTGELVVDRAIIASYNGETLPGEWISDRDVYASGATPTTGAQVVYELATPVTYTLTASEIRTLLGHNNIWADTGDIEVKFKNIKEFF